MKLTLYDKFHLDEQSTIQVIQKAYLYPGNPISIFETTYVIRMTTKENW